MSSIPRSLRWVMSNNCPLVPPSYMTATRACSRRRSVHDRLAIYTITYIPFVCSCYVGCCFYNHRSCVYNFRGTDLRVCYRSFSPKMSSKVKCFSHNLSPSLPPEPGSCTPTALGRYSILFLCLKFCNLSLQLLHTCSRLV